MAKTENSIIFQDKTKEKLQNVTHCSFSTLAKKKSDMKLKVRHEIRQAFHTSFI